MLVACNGIKFHGVNDLSSSYYLEKAELILDEFDEYKQYTDINEIIELFNIKQYIANDMYLKSWNEEKIGDYKRKAKRFEGIIGKFLATINNSNFLDTYKKLSKIYYEDFWDLLCKYKSYKKLTGETVLSLLHYEPYTLEYLLSRMEIISCFSKSIADFMMGYPKSAEFLIGQGLIEKTRAYYFPKELTKELQIELLNRYIDSDDVNINLVRLVGDSQNTSELPLNDELILKARRKYNSVCKVHFENNSGITTTVQVSFEDLGEEIKKIEIDSEAGFCAKSKYNVRWIEGNLDYPTILTNFIYLFELVDWEYRSNCVSLPRQLGIFERFAGVNGKKEYITGSSFNAQQMETNLSINLYYKRLFDKDISLEEVFKWFFEVYLKEEFGADGFVFNASSRHTTYLEKHRNLASEMEGILKQFQLYVDKGFVDRELLEISSNPIVYRNIGSLINSKYIYAKSNELQIEIEHWFSDQTLLGYQGEGEKNYKNLFEFLKYETVNIDDIQEWNKHIIYWLADRGSLKVDENGFIKTDNLRVSLLNHLYNKNIACLSYHKIWGKLVEELLDKGDISVESKLFTNPEVDFINFMLNRSQFSNGYDLRNKYSHGSNTLKEYEQEWHYMELLKIMVLIILKINEEFCLKYPTSDGNVTVS